MALDPEHMESFLPLIRAMVTLCGHGPNRLLDEDDFIQEAMLALLEEWRRHGTAPQPNSHYYQIIKHGYIEAYRRVGLSMRRTGARKEPEPRTMIPIENVAGELGVEPMLDEGILNKELVAFIERLPRRERAVMRALLDDAQQREIARDLNYVEGRITQLKTSGLRHLRVLMEG